MCVCIGVENHLAATQRKRGITEGQDVAQGQHVLSTCTCKRPNFESQQHTEMKQSLSVAGSTRRQTGLVGFMTMAPSVPSLHNPVLTDEELRDTEKASI